MTVIFLALFTTAVILLAISAAPTDRVPAWTWYAGVGALVLAALTAVANGWTA